MMKKLFGPFPTLHEQGPGRTLLVLLIVSFLLAIVRVGQVWLQNQHELEEMIGSVAWTKVAFYAVPRDIDLLRTVRPAKRKAKELANALDRNLIQAAESSDLRPHLVLHRWHSQATHCAGQDGADPVWTLDLARHRASAAFSSPDHVLKWVEARLTSTRNAAERSHPLPVQVVLPAVFSSSNYQESCESRDRPQEPMTEAERETVMEGCPVESSSSSDPPTGCLYQTLQNVGATLQAAYRDFFRTSTPETSPIPGTSLTQATPGLRPKFIYAALNVTRQHSRKLDEWHGLSGEDEVYAFVGFPLGKLPTWYDPADRPWFRSAQAAGQTSTWVRSFEDIGTYEPVFTVSRKLAQHDGVVALDFSPEDVHRRLTVGWPIVLNLTFLFFLCIIFYGILYASRAWTDFRLLFYAFCLFYAYYLQKVFFWTLVDQQTPAADILEQMVDSFLSMANSVALVLAAVFAFRRDQPPRRVGDWLVSRFESYMQKHPGISPLFEGAAVAFILWAAGTVGQLIQRAIDPSASSGGLTFIEIVDVSLACLALVFFGLRFGRWLRLFRGSFLAVAAAGTFVIYGIYQPLYLLIRDHPWFWWTLLVLKILGFTAVLFSVYVWTQEKNWEKLTLAELAYRTFGLEAEDRFILGAKGRYEILFCSDSLALELGLDENDLEASQLGERFVKPLRSRVILPEVFIEGEHLRLVNQLLTAPPDSEGWRTIRNFKTCLRTRHRDEQVPVVVRARARQEYDRRLAKQIWHSVAFLERLPSASGEGQMQGVQAGHSL